MSDYTIPTFDPLDASFAGFAVALLGIGWVRGYAAGSSQTAAEMAEHLAANGPYWPFVAFAVGWVVMGAGVLTWYQHEYRNAPA